MHQEPRKISRDFLRDCQRLFIIGNNDTYHRQLCRHLINKYSESNLSYVVFSGDDQADYRVTLESTQRSIDFQTLWNNSNVTKEIRDNNYNYIYGISDLHNFNELVGLFPDIRTKIIVLNKLDELLKDTKVYKTKSDTNRIQNLLTEQKVLFIADEFPSDKIELCRRYDFSFAFFNKIPEATAYSNIGAFIKDILEIRSQTSRDKTVKKFKDIVFETRKNGHGYNFIFKKIYEEDIYIGTVNEDEQSFLLSPEEYRNQNNGEGIVRVSNLRRNETHYDRNQDNERLVTVPNFRRTERRLAPRSASQQIYGPRNNLRSGQHASQRRRYL